MGGEHFELFVVERHPVIEHIVTNEYDTGSLISMFQFVATMCCIALSDEWTCSAFFDV